MRQFPFVMWQQPPDMVGSARFFIGVSEEINQAPTKNDGKPPESLRSDLIVELSNCFTQAAIDHPHLACALMDALDHAIEAVLLIENHRELRLIQRWLCQEAGKKKRSEI